MVLPILPESCVTSLSGMVLPILPESCGDAEEQCIILEAASALQFSLGLREDLPKGFELVGDIRGALNFLFASRDAKPCRH